MSLSFAAGTMTLSTWGFAPGDIAVLAGASRTAGTWLMTQMKDQTLLEFMKIDREDLIRRKGIIDLNSLHDRWDRSLILLKNGKKAHIEPGAGHAVDAMGVFSWFMTLIASSLDAALSLTSMRKLFADFLMIMFEDNEGGLEYLLRETPQHVQGWVSAGCVRGITAKARFEWQRLESEGVHLPGLVPHDDTGEILRLLLWLAGCRDPDKSSSFETSSSDAMSIAIILRSIGFDCLCFPHLGEKRRNEAQIEVRLNQSVYRGSLDTNRTLRPRFGMRIPLDCMEECVSLWPGSANTNNKRRALFKQGSKAAENINISIGVTLTTPDLEKKDEPNQIFFKCQCDTSQVVGRLNPGIYDFLSSVFPMFPPSVCAGMQSIMDSRRNWQETPNVDNLMQYLSTDRDCLSEVQSYTLGFFYTMLLKVLDTSQLQVAEVFGSWQWYDENLFYRIAQILGTGLYSVGTKSADTLGQAFFKKSALLKLIALLFVGAEEEQVELVTSQVIGVHGRISVFSSSLMGDTDSFVKVGKFVLTDVDASCIPSSSRGIVTASKSRPAMRVTKVPKQRCLVAELDGAQLPIDFTSHIEPDWDFDTQATTIVFRDRGRLVRRWSPLDIERAFALDANAYLGHHLFHSEYSEVNMTIQHVSLLSPTASEDEAKTHELLIADTTDFSASVFGPGVKGGDVPVFIPVCGKSKARTCLRTLYSKLSYERIYPENVGNNLWLRSLDQPRTKDILPRHDTMVLFNPSSLLNRDIEINQPGRRVILA